MHKIVETLSDINSFNLVMLVLIVVLGFAIHRIGKDNQRLHEKNVREKAREEKVFGESTHIALH